MAKLIDRLHELGKRESTPIGFGRRVAKKQNPALLLIGGVATHQLSSFIDAGTLDCLDAVILDAVPDAGQTSALGENIWGVRLSNAEEEALDALKEAGCDFIFIDSDDILALVMRDDGMGVGRTLPLDVTDRQARVLDDLPFDFLTLSYTAEPQKLTLQDLLGYQAAVSMVGKHILLETEGLPSKAELALLRDLPVEGIIVPASEMSMKEGEAARELINSIEPRKPRSHHEAPAIAQSGTFVADVEMDDPDFDDDDDYDVVVGPPGNGTGKLG